MYYLGGKSKIAKQITPYTLMSFGNGYNTYIEPFVGGGNMMKHVPIKEGCTCVGYDKNNFLVALLNYAQYVLNAQTPTTCSNPNSMFSGNFPLNLELLGSNIDKVDYDLYRKIAQLDNEQRLACGVCDEVLGYAGFIWSYRGDFFQGYSGREAPKAFKAFLKTAEGLKGKHIYCSDYKNIWLPDTPAIIYVDPPYKHERYVGLGFKAHWLELMDYDELYNTMRYWKSLGHLVYMSERTAPHDFYQVWKKEVGITMINGADWKNEGLGKYAKEAKRKDEILYCLF